MNSKSPADEIEAQLKKGASFAALAKKYSKDPSSAKQGGKLVDREGPDGAGRSTRWRSRIKTGVVSAPVHSQYGWHIIEAMSADQAGEGDAAREREAVDRADAATAEEDGEDERVGGRVKKEYAKKLAYGVGYTPSVTTTAATNTTTTG